MPTSIDYFDARLAKRLAEAADSFRDGLFHYFVCNTGFPYDLHYTGGYEDKADASNEANTLKQGLSSDYIIFGPYKTEINDEPAIEYDSIQVKFMQGSEEFYSETLTNDIDAIILSLSAYDKFFQPYYVRLYGMEIAAEFRTKAITALSLSQLVGHRGGLSAGPGTGGTKYVAGEYER